MPIERAVANMASIAEHLAQQVGGREALARLLGVPYATVLKWCSGDEIPSEESLYAMQMLEERLREQGGSSATTET